jgi:hypothetical protein
MMLTKISAFTGDLRLPLRLGRRVTLSLLPLLLLLPLALELEALRVDFLAGFLPDLLSATLGSQQIKHLEADHADVAGTEGHDDVAGLGTLDEMTGHC